ncbi:hypothetical protein JL720_4217 [Aureococcus anophagefferens]|nr:hypothetical protein JL720_4217 [Aureococcus anophagefferens]
MKAAILLLAAARVSAEDAATSAPSMAPLTFVVAGVADLRGAVENATAGGPCHDVFLQGDVTLGPSDGTMVVAAGACVSVVGDYARGQRLRIRDNVATASRGGGGIFGAGAASLTVANSKFVDLWQPASNGGSIACVQCVAVVVAGCEFVGSYSFAGGGSLAVVVLPTHEAALDAGLLEVLTPNGAAPNSAFTYFISQNWETFGESPHPDNARHTKLRWLKNMRRHMRIPAAVDEVWIWWDLVSVPQARANRRSSSTRSTRSATTPSSAAASSRWSATSAWLALGESLKNPVFPTAGTLETYAARGWCRLEILAALAPKKFSTGAWRPGPRSLRFRYHHDPRDAGVGPVLSPELLRDPTRGNFTDPADADVVRPVLRLIADRYAEYARSGSDAACTPMDYADMDNDEKKKARRAARFAADAQQPPPPPPKKTFAHPGQDDVQQGGGDAQYLARRGDSLNAAQRAALAGVAPPAAAGADGDRADKVFVGNLPFSTTSAGLRAMFERYEIKGAKIVADRATNRSKGFGFVTFATEADAAAAVQAFAGVSVEAAAVRALRDAARHGQAGVPDDPDEPAAPMAHTARAEAAGGDSLDAAEALSPRAAAAALNTEKREDAYVEPVTLWKIAVAADVAAWEAAGVLRGSDLDVRDGFLHFSDAKQVKVVAALFFKGVPAKLARLDVDFVPEGARWHDGAAVADGALKGRSGCHVRKLKDGCLHAHADPALRSALFDADLPSPPTAKTTPECTMTEGPRSRPSAALRSRTSRGQTRTPQRIDELC